MLGFSHLWARVTVQKLPSTLFWDQPAGSSSQGAARPASDLQIPGSSLRGVLCVCVCGGVLDTGCCVLLSNDSEAKVFRSLIRHFLTVWAVRMLTYRDE